MGKSIPGSEEHFASSRTCSLCQRSGGYAIVGFRPPRCCIGQRKDGSLYLYNTKPVAKIIWQFPIVRKYPAGIFCWRCLKKNRRTETWRYCRDFLGWPRLAGIDTPPGSPLPARLRKK